MNRLVLTRRALTVALGAAAVAMALAGPATASPQPGHAPATAASHAAKPAPVPPTHHSAPVVTPKPRSTAPTAAQPMTAYSVAIRASNYTPWGGQTSTITATSNVDVGPTPYYIVIDEQYTGAVLAVCGTGTTCSADVSYSTPQLHQYFALIVSYNIATGQTSNEQAQDPQPSFNGGMPINWHGADLTLSAGYTTLPLNGVTTLTATASQDVGPSPFYIEIFDATTGTEVGSPCGSGTTCSGTVTQTAAGAHRFVAYLSQYGNAYPAADVQNTSLPSWVTWSPGGLQLTLSAPATATRSSTATATANVDLTNTPYSIEIFDDEAGILLGSCKSGTTCTVSYQPQHYGLTTLVAFVSDQDPAFPPANTQASSNLASTNISQLIP